DLGAMGADQARQDVNAVHDRGPLPGQVVEPDVVELHAVRGDLQRRGELPLEPDGDVAQADRAVPGVEQRAGDDPDRVGEVDDPCAGGGAALDPFGDIQHDR